MTQVHVYNLAKLLAAVSRDTTGRPATDSPGIALSYPDAESTMRTVQPTRPLPVGMYGTGGNFITVLTGGDDATSAYGSVVFGVDPDDLARALLTDSDGRALSKDEETNDLLRTVLAELQAMNTHLSHMTGLEVTGADMEID